MYFLFMWLACSDLKDSSELGVATNDQKENHCNHMVYHSNNKKNSVCDESQVEKSIKIASSASVPGPVSKSKKSLGWQVCYGKKLEEAKSCRLFSFQKQLIFFLSKELIFRVA